jgi:drug/metabolite transporter (DMT)-like permease
MSSVPPPVFDPRLIASLSAVYVIWGSTYYAMRVAVHGLPPLLMGAMRFTVAGIILLGFALARGAKLPTAAQWRYLIPVGILFFVGGTGFGAIAETSIDSGVAAVVCATMPLWAALAAAITGERPSTREWLGLGLGFAGVVVLIGGVPAGGDLGHLTLLLLSPVSWGVGSIIARRMPGPSNLGTAGIQMIVGGLAVGMIALARGERISSDAPAEAWIAVVYLATFGSLIAFSAYMWLLRNTRPAVATSYAFVNPAIAVLIGGVLGGEVLGPSTILATGLIVAAVAIVIVGKAAAPPK